MSCVHLRQLYQLCETHQLKLTSSDLVRIVCPQCQIVDVCPSMYSAEYDRRILEKESMSQNETKLAKAPAST